MIKSSITKEWAMKAAAQSAANETESDICVQASRPTGRLLSTSPYDHPEQCMLYLNGREGGSFHCTEPRCGGNVFTLIAPGLYECNSCQARYIGTPKDGVMAHT